MIKQTVIKSSPGSRSVRDQIWDTITDSGAANVLLVCDAAFDHLAVRSYFDNPPVRLIVYNDIRPNPDYDSMVRGVRLFQREACDYIVAVGGGSAMDVAKCIKLFGNMDADRLFFDQQAKPHDAPLMAFPTTAGTGSEATRFAVVYYWGEKQSISDEAILPGAVVLDPLALSTLPPYHRRATMMDALCHAVESFWSVHSNDESMEYSARAIRQILSSMEAYLGNTERGNQDMLLAANLAGKAINITQTTAGHAMSYKLTSMYQIAHGHAAALCLPAVWRYMLGHMEQCADSRGAAYVKDVFGKIARCMGCETSAGACEKLENLLINLELSRPEPRNRDDIELLTKSVNPVRLKNNPVYLSEQAIGDIYTQILN